MPLAVRSSAAGAQKLSVTAGGRLASPLAIPPSTDVCYPNYLVPPGELGASLQLFIGPSGLATSQFGYWGITAAVRFGKARPSRPSGTPPRAKFEKPDGIALPNKVLPPDKRNARPL